VFEPTLSVRVQSEIRRRIVSPDRATGQSIVRRHRLPGHRLGHVSTTGLASLSCALVLFLTACSTLSPVPPGGVGALEAAVVASEGTAGETLAVTVDPPSEWAEAVLYFVILDRFADGDPTNDGDVDLSGKGTFHGGDLRGLREHLDELADLGVTALWITPVVKNIDGFVTGAGFPDWGYHGYWADDFQRLDPRFGDEAELTALVQAAHRRGMSVLLDVVYNHAGYGSRYATDPTFRSWVRVEARGECGDDDVTSCVAGLPDFRTELPEVADYLFDAHLSLAERVGLDGFRLDTVKHVSHAFWQEHRQRVRGRLGDDFFLLGEVWGGDARSLDPWFRGDEMDAGFDFSFRGNVLAFLQGRGRPVAFERYLEKRREVRDGYLLAPYLSSHDVPGALFELGDDRQLFRLAALLQFVVDGIPTIYYGEEVGRLGGDWPDNRSDMPWGDRDVLPGRGLPRDEAMRQFYRRLIQIRRQHPALWRGDHTLVDHGADHLVFARADAVTGDRVLVAINRADAPVVARVPVPEDWRGQVVRDLLTDASFDGSGESLELPLPPRSGRLVTISSRP